MPGVHEITKARKGLVRQRMSRHQGEQRQTLVLQCDVDVATAHDVFHGGTVRVIWVLVSVARGMPFHRRHSLSERGRHEAKR